VQSTARVLFEVHFKCCLGKERSDCVSHVVQMPRKVYADHLVLVAEMSRLMVGVICRLVGMLSAVSPDRKRTG